MTLLNGRGEGVIFPYMYGWHQNSIGHQFQLIRKFKKHFIPFPIRKAKNIFVYQTALIRIFHTSFLTTE